MTSDFDRVKDCRERGLNYEMEEPKAKAEPMRVQSPKQETLSGDRRDKCEKKKPDHKGGDDQFVFIIFLVLILLLFSKY